MYTIVPSEQDSITEGSVLEDELVPCLTPGTSSNSSSSSSTCCSTESAWEIIQSSPQGKKSLGKCSAPFKKRRQLDFPVNTDDCIPINQILSGTARLVNYSSSSQDSATYEKVDMKRADEEHEGDIVVMEEGTECNGNKRGGTEDGFGSGSTVEEGKGAVLFEGANGGKVYVRRDLVGGSNVVNYFGNEVFWASSQDSVEHGILDEEILNHLKNLNIQVEDDEKEVDMVEQGAVEVWEDGITVRAEPVAQLGVEEFDFGDAEEFRAELAALGEQSQVLGGGTGEE